MNLNVIIPDRLIGQRIDSALVTMLSDYSRSKITTWVKSGSALINDKTFNAYTLPKVHQLGDIARHAWYIV